MHYKVGFIFNGNREEKEDWNSTPNKLDSESNSGHLSYSLVTYHKCFLLSACPQFAHCLFLKCLLSPRHPNQKARYSRDHPCLNPQTSSLRTSNFLPHYHVLSSTLHTQHFLDMPESFPLSHASCST
jgi:hypothetical protein